MCGQVGVFGNIAFKEENFFRELWQIDVLRGDDSSGVAFINAQNHVKVLRAIGPPYKVMYSRPYEKASRKTHLCIIGHNRFATIGSVTVEMAHPHYCGNIIGTHNGTLRNRHRLPDIKEYESDSEQLFASIDSQGLKETWKNLDGAAAIIWWDRNNRTLNMIKNSERSLYFVYMNGDKDGPTMAWASEAWMLESIAARKGIKIGTLWRPIIDTHYAFSYDKKKKIVNYTAQKLEKFTYLAPAKLQGAKDYEWPYKGKVWSSKRLCWETPEEQKRNDGNKLPFDVSAMNENYYDKPKNELSSKNMSEEQFKKDYQVCAYCEKDLDEDGYLTSVIIDMNLALCNDCSSLSEACGMPFKDK